DPGRSIEGCTPVQLRVNVKAFRLFTLHHTPPACPKDIRDALALPSQIRPCARYDFCCDFRTKRNNCKIA
ncbi:MAG TPA: hypothetical protein VGO27_11525, partial [Candidatus Acidoferrum sp.]|nr:hypothetical protein [Candidatus Acidoferrum sp.]